jgi:hypothetical protein
VIGDDPGNTDNDPDPSEKAISQGEGGACLPLLSALRQDLPSGHPASCLCAGPSKCGRAGYGRNDLCGGRSVGPGEVAGGPARGTCFRRGTGPIRCGGCPYRSRTEASDRSASRRSGIGWSRPPPSSCWNRSSRRTSRTMPTATARSWSGGRGQGSAPADLPGAYRRGRCRFIPLLRFDSAR